LVAHPVLVPLVQVVPQVAPLHAKLFAHADEVPPLHVPVPLQVLAVVAVLPVHDAGRHCVVEP
jgi:hypothetical protein